jgi:hypothetical protein
MVVYAINLQLVVSISNDMDDFFVVFHPRQNA